MLSHADYSENLKFVFITKVTSQETKSGFLIFEQKESVVHPFYILLIIFLFSDS